MRRREFLSALGGAAVWPVTAGAQQAPRQLAKIGLIFTFQSENSAAFFRGLRAAGYEDGRNAEMVTRLYGNELDRLDNSVRELVALKCGVIFASNPYVIQKAVKATTTIPIVGVDLESDPVASGLVKSMARPGGNFTGFFLDIPELGGKQIELLTEAVPTISRLGILWDETIGTVQFHATETARRPKGVVLQSLPIRRPEDINSAFERAGRGQVQGVVVLSSPLIFAERSHIADLALKARLPTINLFNTFTKFGGLMAYGPNFPSIYEQAATYVARILAGEHAGDLPIQRPIKFELGINLKTAEALGLSIPETLLIRADEVIE